MTDPDSSTVPEQVTVGDLTFDVGVTGPRDGRVVLLLHGFPQTSWSWRHVVPGLASAGRRVLALDQRGYSPGASPDAVADYTGEHLVADVVGVLDALGLDAVDLVGHDWGAAVAWQVAGLHPERVTTLTALSVPHPGAFREALAADADQRARSAYMRDFARPGYEDVLLADDAAGLRSLFGAGSGVDVEHVLARIGTPTRLRRARTGTPRSPPTGSGPSLPRRCPPCTCGPTATRPSGSTARAPPSGTSGPPTSSSSCPG